MQKNIKTKRYLIAGGNPTLLVWDSSFGQEKPIIQKFINSVDQIGFINKGILKMMGGELCINATLAFASTLARKGFLRIDPLPTPIGYINFKTSTKIRFPLNYQRIGNLVLLEGIGFKLETLGYKVTKSELKFLSQKYSLPAFGIILLKRNQIFPFIYVKETNTLKAESACGSGSIATCIFTGLRKIKQPTGEDISVDLLTKNIVSVTASINYLKPILKGGDKYE